MTRRRARTSLAAVPALCLALAGCGGAEVPAPGGVRRTVTVSSSAFGSGGAIPRRFTCDGEDVSPPLRWRGVPSRARALALVVDDPDAADGPYVHWVVVDIAVGATGVGEGSVPARGVQARTSAGRAGYTGPCPPGGTHHYRFTVYALDRATGLRPGAGLAAALEGVRRHAVTRGTLTGTYHR